MNDLIKIESTPNGLACSAREMYIGVGLKSQNWSRWAKTNIEGSIHFQKGKDWITLHQEDYSGKGQKATDYIVSIRFAKHLAMMANTEKAVEYRDYFLSLEMNPQNELGLQIGNAITAALTPIVATLERINTRMDSMEEREASRLELEKRLEETTRESRIIKRMWAAEFSRNEDREDIKDLYR